MPLHRGPEQRQASLLRLAPVLGGLGAIGHALRFTDLSHALDDAWISFRTARNLVEHGVLSFDLSRPPVEGMLLSAVWIALLPDVDPIGPARVVGLLLHGAMVLLAVRLVGRIVASHDGRSSVAAGLTALVLATSGSLAFYAMSGLETALWTFLFVLGLDRIQEGRHGQAGVVLGLLAMTRPEGVLVGGLIAGGSLLGSRMNGIRVLAPFVGLVVAMELFRWTTYGALVPNTFYAKAPVATDGLDYLSTFWTLGLGVVGPLVILPALRLPRARLLVGVLAVLLAGVAWSSGDWMPGYRRCSLVLVGIAILGGVGAGLAQARVQQGLVGIGALGLLGGSLLSAVQGADSGSFTHDRMADIGERAAASEQVETVALVDIGRFGWHFTGSVVDLVGLTDAHLAHLPGGHADKPWDEAWFRAAAPDLLIARSESPITDPLVHQPRLGLPERGMVRSVLNHGGYRLHTVIQPTQGQWLLIFGRDGLVLDPSIWGPPRDKGLRQLLIERSQH